MPIKVSYRLETRNDLVWIIYNQGGDETVVGTILKQEADADPQLVADVKAAFDAWFYRKIGVRSQLALPDPAHVPISGLVRV